MNEGKEAAVKSGVGRQNSKIDAVHDGKKIKKIVDEKGFKPIDVITAIGYAKGNKNAYTRLTDGDSALGVRGLSNLAEFLGLDVFDLLQDEYKNKIANASLVRFSNTSELNRFLYSYEQEYKGRTAVFNSFPSLLYYADLDQARLARYGYLTKHGINNHEYYPLRSILNFGFSEFSIFSKDQKIKILREFIGSFDLSANFRVFVVVDGDDFIYSPFASDCEILGNEVLIISAPFYQNSLLVIKSANTVDDILDSMFCNRERIMDENRVKKMLMILLQCLEKGADLMHFITALKQNQSRFYEYVMNVVSDDIKKQLL